MDEIMLESTKPNQSAADELFGYESVNAELEQFITKPGHIFLLGNTGSGKTTLIRNFLKRYFEHHYDDATREKAQQSDVFFMNSHQDRGIHTVRNVLLDYVRQPTCKPGTVRWIIIDHLESFPELSQQALRRPMELYSHVACFIFIGTNRSHIIPPLLSRCRNIMLPDIQLEQISGKIMVKYNATAEIIPADTMLWLISHSAGVIREFCQYIQLIVNYVNLMKPEIINIHNIVIEICSIPSFDVYMPLITAILSDNKLDVLKNLTKLWIVGESFEDVFDTLKHMVEMFGYTSHTSGQRLYKFLMNGWVQYSHGYTTYRSLILSGL